MENSILLTEDQIIAKMRLWMAECDADEFARITGEIFGGKCEMVYDAEDNQAYEFTPNEMYFGEFGGEDVTKDTDLFPVWDMDI